MLKKLSSKKGQVSVEIGIIIFSVVVISAITAYYNIKVAKETRMDATGVNANRTIAKINQTLNHSNIRLNDTAHGW